MRPWFRLIVPALLFTAVAFSAPPPLSPVLPAPKDDEPVLPLKIPGYELRVLDQRKPLRLGVAATWVEASLPIFFYYPTADRIHALGCSARPTTNCGGWDKNPIGPPRNSSK